MNSATLKGDTDHLRKHFHEEIDRMDPQRLAKFQSMLRLIDLIEASEQLSQGFDADEAAGRLEPAKIARVIEEVRAGRR